MNTTVTFGDSRRELLKGSDAVMEVGECKTQPGKITFGAILDFEFNVTASADTVALTAPQRNAVLEACEFSFSAYANLKNKIDCYEKESLLILRNDAERLLRRDWEGVEDSTTGLAKAFVTGNNQLLFRALVPLSYVAGIEEARKLFGLGYEQMLLSKMWLKLGSDPFKAAAATLTLAKSYVTFSPLWDTGHRMFMGLPLVAEEFVNAQKKDVSTAPGMPVSVEQMVPLADTELATITVGVGPVAKLTDDQVLITAEEATPAAIQAQYEQADGVKDSTVEKLIKGARTLVYGFGNTKFSQVRAGIVTAAQKTLDEAWKVRAVYFPYVSTPALYEYLQAIADMLPPKRQILAVNASTFDKVDANEAQLPFSGLVIFTDEDTDFYDHVGLRAVSGGNVVEVYIPPDKGRQFGALAVDAMQSSTTYLNGDTGKVKSLRETYLWEVPGLINNPQGLKFATAIASEGNAKLSDAISEAEQRRRQAQAMAARLGGPAANTSTTATQAKQKKAAGAGK